MGKHHSADEKLVSQSVRKVQTKLPLQTPSDYSAPQGPKTGTTARNQYH